MSYKKGRTLGIILLFIIIPINGLIISNLKNIIGANNLAPVKTMIFNPNAEDELVIYAHDSLLAWGLEEDFEEVMNTTFYDFGTAHGVTIKLQLFDGMVNALQTLISQKNNPQADVIICLDSVLANEAKSAGVLQPYTDANLENISASLVNDLDPEKYLIPIDYGLIAIIFDTEFITTSNYPQLTQLTFEDLLTTFAEDLTVQDPTLSSTGINFLLYQLVFYEEILDLDWKSWWEEAEGVVTIDKSWSDSWERVFSAKEAHMLVSYGTDPAYNAFFNYSFEQNAAILHDDGGIPYGWLQIEGISLVQGTTKLELAKDFIDHFLSERVQALIPTNNWMFPANEEVELPPCYDYAIDPEDTTLLNDLVTAQYIGENYRSWLTDWERLIYGRGLWWLWVTIGSALIIAASVVTIYIYRKRRKLEIE